MFVMKAVLVIIVLAAVLYALGRWLHGMIYTDVPEGLAWRAPVAALGVGLVSLVWPLLFNAWSESKTWPMTLEDLMGVKQRAKDSVGVIEFREFLVPLEGGQAATFRRLRTDRGAYEYRDDEGRRLPAGTQELIGLTSTGDKVRFKADKDDRGRIRYLEVEGERVMTGDEFGVIRPSGAGQFFLNLFGVAVTIGGFFVCFWLLMLFQLGHALGLAVVLTPVWLFALNAVSW